MNLGELTGRDGCVFCTQACEDPDAYDALRGEPGPSLLLGSYDGFRVLQDNAPLTLSHILIVPDEHVRSMALLAPQRRRVAEEVVARLARRFADLGQGSFLFEHGTGATCDVPACCLEHAHAHLVDVDFDPTGWFSSRDVPVLITLNQFSDIGRVGDREYLLAWRFGGVGVVYDSTGLPSQLFRSLLGEHVGEGLWNWQDRLAFESAQEQAQRLFRCVDRSRPIVLEALQTLSPVGS